MGNIHLISTNTLLTTTNTLPTTTNTPQTTTNTPLTTINIHLTTTNTHSTTTKFHLTTNNTLTTTTNILILVETTREIFHNPFKPFSPLDQALDKTLCPLAKQQEHKTIIILFQIGFFESGKLDA